MDTPTPAQAPDPALAIAPEAAFLTPNQSAALLGISRSTFNRVVSSGEVPFHVLGKRRKFRRADLLAYVEGTRRFEPPPSTNLAAPAEKAKTRSRPVPIASHSPLAATLNRAGRKSLNPFSDKLRQAEGGAR